jgi:hypothetical protein
MFASARCAGVPTFIGQIQPMEWETCLANLDQFWTQTSDWFENVTTEANIIRLSSALIYAITERTLPQI